VIGAAPAQVPGVAVSVSPRFPTPVITGRPVGTGLDGGGWAAGWICRGRTTAVGSELTGALRAGPLLAISWTRIVSPSGCSE
jgi:hypothetical protein